MFNSPKCIDHNTYSKYRNHTKVCFAHIFLSKPFSIQLTKSSAKPQTNIMKAFIVLPITLLPTVIHAWTLTLGGKVWNGGNNRGCTSSPTSAGQQLDWSNAWYSDCCVHLYSDGSCGSQVGYSCNDWKKKLSQYVGSFKVDSC